MKHGAKRLIGRSITHAEPDRPVDNFWDNIAIPDNPPLPTAFWHEGLPAPSSDGPGNLGQVAALAGNPTHPIIG